MINNRIGRCLLIVCLFFVSVLQAHEYPVITIDGEDFYQYQVEKSEGFFSISRKFGVGQDELLKYNPQLKDGLKVDQIIFVPIKNKVETTAATPAATQPVNNAVTPPATVKTESPQQVKKQYPIKLNFIEHEVERKETMYSISQKFYIPIDSIYKYNPESVEKIRKGDILLLPVHAIKADEIKGKQEEDKLYELHTVLEKETLYGISKKYNVTVDHLNSLNPYLKERVIRKGDVIRVALKEDKAAVVDVQPQDTVEAVVDTVVATPMSVIKVAFLMPFMLDASKPDPAADKFIDFYQGALIAIESLKERGISVDIYTFDTDRSIEKVNKILAQPELKTMNLIVGPAYTPHVKPVSDFAREHKIRMVVPFSAKTEEAFTNPYLYQSNIHQDILDEEMAKVFADVFKEKNIIILNFKGVNEHLTTQMISALNTQSVPYRIKTIPTDSIQSYSIDKYLVSDNENIVLLSTTNPATLARVMPAINKTNKEFSLFGFLEWTQLSKTQEEIFIHDTYICSPFYLDYKQEAVKQFFRSYISAFGYENTKTIPHYSLLGYDITSYFLEGLSKFGNALEDNLDLIDSESLQMGFSFEKVNDKGGYVNKNVFLSKYKDGDKIIIE